MFSSRPFEFIVQGKVFFIHEALIPKVSTPLERLISGEMSEAQKGLAHLRAEDEATFARFCHWAYTGFYHPEDFSERPKGENLAVELDDGMCLIIPFIVPGLRAEHNCFHRYWILRLL